MPQFLVELPYLFLYFFLITLPSLFFPYLRMVFSCTDYVDIIFFALSCPYTFLDVSMLFGLSIGALRQYSHSVKIDFKTVICLCLIVFADGANIAERMRLSVLVFWTYAFS